jgi:hypothetical protein
LGLGRIGAGRMESDTTYYSRRAAEERAAAVQSNNIIVHDRHLELAQAYEYRVREMAKLERRSAFTW